jgi:hypothetical protein
MQVTIIDALTAEVPSAEVAQQWLVDFTDQHGYRETLTQPDGTSIENPVSRVAYRQQIVAQFVQDSIRARRVQQAVETAQQAALEALESEVQLS